MDFSIIALFGADMILMAGVFYALMRSREKKSEGIVCAQTDGAAVEAGLLTQELKEEISGLRKVMAELEKRRTSFELYENDIERKGKKLDAMIKRAEDAARDAEAASSSRLSEDVYLKATKMMKKGMNPDDVKNSLGLLNGEAELVSALRNYRV
ncbi:MAG: hypothetical protein AAB307_06400 [Deltaproteobacteria bacterium]